MVAPRVLRRWLWRANAVLGCIACVVAADLLWPSEPAPPSLLMRSRSQPRRQAEPAIDLELIRRFNEQMYGRAAPARLGASVPSADQSTRLPLAAFKPLMLVTVPGQPRILSIRSKDPAHPESHALVEGEPEHGFLLERVEVQGRTALAHVRRGAEVFAYTIDLDGPAPARDVLRLPGEGAAGASRRPGPGVTPSAQEQAIDEPATIKWVPHYAADGHVAGARVTGVRPGSHFQQLGIRPGDVIQKLADRDLGVPDGWATALGPQSRPTSILVLRGVHEPAGGKAVRLGG